MRLSAAELATYDGTDGKPILLSIRGTVYDVTKGRDFYGPGGAYPFAGKEVARALAKTSLDKQVPRLACLDHYPERANLQPEQAELTPPWVARSPECACTTSPEWGVISGCSPLSCPPSQDFNANLEGLSHTEMRTLGEWERKFQSKYRVVGTLET